MLDYKHQREFRILRVVIVCLTVLIGIIAIWMVHLIHVHPEVLKIFDRKVSHSDDINIDQKQSNDDNPSVAVGIGNHKSHQIASQIDDFKFHNMLLYNFTKYLMHQDCVLHYINQNIHYFGEHFPEDSKQNATIGLYSLYCRFQSKLA